MLLNMTPSGNETQRKMLLNHSCSVRNIFLFSLLLLPLAIILGQYYSKSSSDSGLNAEYLKNIAMVHVDNGDSSSQGTAFLVCDNNGVPTGYLFTARHVVDGTVSKEVHLTFPQILDENEVPLETTASIVWTTEVPFDGADLQSLRYDVCLLKLNDISVLPDDVTGFFIGEDMEIKQSIAIYGFPAGEEYATSGEISSTNYSNSQDLMLLSFQIDHGLSGAPIYSEETGEVLGIAIASETQTDIKNIALKMKRVVDLMDRDGIKNLLK